MGRTFFKPGCIFLLTAALSAMPAAAQATFVESFEGGTNHGRWSWGTGNEQIIPLNGNPGTYLKDTTLLTFTPAASTAFGDLSQFTGNYRARGVSLIGVDLVIEATSLPATTNHPLTLMLLNDNDTPGDLEDDWGAYFISENNIPSPGVGTLTGPSRAAGWNTYSFDVPSQEADTPTGWIFFDCSVSEYCEFTPAGQAPSGPNDWSGLLSNVDAVFFYYNDPVQHALLASWNVGLDNPRITADSLSGDLDGNGEVNLADIRSLTPQFGACVPPDPCLADLNGDGVVDKDDLLVLLALAVERIQPRVRMAADKQTLDWAVVPSAISYNVYRGDLSALGDPTVGDFGDCQNHFDPDTTDTTFVDSELPDGAYFYLVTLVTATGEMGFEGASQGQLRDPLTRCP